MPSEAAAQAGNASCVSTASAHDPLDSEDESDGGDLEVAESDDEAWRLQ